MVGYKIEGDIIKLEGKITIEKPCAEVFKYVADLRNDCQWRTEIKKTEINDQKVSLNCLAKEHSYLSKKAPDFIYELRCIGLEENARIDYSTTEKSSFYQKNTRIVEAIGNDKTHFTYKIEFDTKVVKFALGIGLPKWIIAYKANSDIKKYLNNLRTVIKG